jgi:hypothetical protein
VCVHSLATIKIKNNALLYTFERIMFSNIMKN